MNENSILKNAMNFAIDVEPHYLDYDYELYEDYDEDDYYDDDDDYDDCDDDDLDKESGLDIEALKSYRRRIKRMKKQRGNPRLKSRRYYIRHRPQVKRNQKRYRMRRAPQLRLRRKQGPHFKRIGDDLNTDAIVEKVASQLIEGLYK